MDLQHVLQTRLEGAVYAGAAPGIAAHLRLGAEQVGAAAGERQVGRGMDLTLQSRFPIGCLIKPLLSLLTVELAVSGWIDLDVPVEAYLPELRPLDPGLPSITLRHLLSHTAGYREPDGRDARWTLTWDAFVDLFRRREQAFRPGSVWSYTQTGHAIVARIVEQATDQDPMQLILDRILRPLSITPGAPYDPRSAPADNVALHVAHPQQERFQPIRLPREPGLFRHSISDLPLGVRDLTALGAALSAPGLFDAEVLQLVTSPAVAIPPCAGGPLREMTPTAYGLGLAHYGPLLGHNGSFVGASCALRFLPRRAAAAAAATNAWNPGVRDRLLTTLLSEATGEASLALTPPPRAPAGPLDRYVGEYQGLMLGLGRATLAAEGDGLRLSVDGGQGAQARLMLGVGPEGRLAVRGDAGALSVGLGAAPGSGDPYLLLGMSAYRRID
jgi:CubicO group peptidase (beta-lactamase class C family)